MTIRPPAPAPAAPGYARIDPLTLANQRRASDPAACVWVSANAGSGKTHVLAQRVVRLLLDGAQPGRILCLTFTKAAAANMSMRVFDMLARWTRLDDAALSLSIMATGAPEPDARALREARKLFARAVETPGGLKIQTIHAFCERVLHLFPFEANAPSRFEVADEQRQADLLSRARRDVLARAANGTDRLADAVAQVAEDCGGDGFETLLREALGLRALLREDWPGDHEAALRETLGLAPGRDVRAIRLEMIGDASALARWTALADFLEGGSSNDVTMAAAFREAARLYGQGDEAGCLDACLRVFFTTKGERRARLMTGGLAKRRPDLAAGLVEEQTRLEGLRDPMRAAGALARSAALGLVVDAIIQRYREIKAARSLLDYDDLVGKTLALLERSDASWVLYKLDAGIDHILVDEAQDTSAAQWRILEGLMADFAVGAGRAGPRRSFFAVGDEKQSIFSFQGAAPRMFDEMRRKLELRFTRAGMDFEHVRLTHSFRSAPGVLSAVDRLFGERAFQGGLVSPADVWMPHEAVKAHLPSLVEIWPAIGAEQGADARDWRLPLDALDETDPASLVAQRVAEKIARLTDPKSDERIHDPQTGAARPIRPGDVLILVRKRAAFFEAVIRALKRKGVPVAGADRLKLGEHIAVLDLVAAGRAALLPEDDLNLAAALKSPLVDLDDDDLIALAPNRAGSLYAALEAAEGERFATARETLARWRSRAALRPFAFYMSLLAQDRGRCAFEARLGREAVDAIDEFLRLALDAERDPAPSLVRFLIDFETLERSVKRDMESGGDVVRVMTVHAAKGLEAGIVFLPDTCGGVSTSHEPRLFALGEGGPVARPILWSPRKSEDCAKAAAARGRQRDLAEEEYRRLLYVAMTRAQERVYIAGFYKERLPPSCWSTMIATTLATDPTMISVPAFWDEGQSVLRRTAGAVAAVAPAIGRLSSTPPAEAPAWLSRPAERPAASTSALSPSRALEADRRRRRLAAGARRRAVRAGELTHVLLQYLPDLPACGRGAAARAFLEARAGDLDGPAREALIEAALQVIDAPDLAPLFGPQSKAEVGVAGRAALPDGSEFDIAGRIDRIGVTADEVLVGDFKTGARPDADDVPASYLIQMALYRAVLASLWPGRRLRALLIWTEGPRVDEIEPARLDAALALIAQRRGGGPTPAARLLDGGAGRS